MSKRAEQDREPSEEEIDRILARLAESPLTDEGSFALPGGVTLDSVREELENLDEKKEKSWTHSMLVLGGSLLLFSLVGLQSSTLTNLLVLIAVLLIHESGHYLGMRLFQYRNVQMYFIPFFGAAVSGKNDNVAGWKVAVVALLGPLPGLLLGIGAGCIYLRRPDPWIGQLSLYFLLVNGLNLLPFLPLDGGRFCNEVLFSRSRHLELIFRIITGGLLALIGVKFGLWVLIAAGAFVVLFSGHTFKISKLAKEAREQALLFGEEQEIADAQSITPEMLLGIRRAFPFVQTPKEYAQQAKEVVEKMNSKPPGRSSTIALLGVYVAGVASMIVFVILFYQFTFGAWNLQMSKGHDAFQAQHFSEAEGHYRAAADTALRFGQKDVRRGDSLFAVADACRGQSKFSEAEMLYRDAWKAYEVSVEPTNPRIASTLEGLAATLRELKHPEEATALEARAQEIRKFANATGSKK